MIEMLTQYQPAAALRLPARPAVPHHYKMFLFLSLPRLPPIRPAVFLLITWIQNRRANTMVIQETIMMKSNHRHSKARTKFMGFPEP
jgi:hypothetical protein